MPPSTRELTLLHPDRISNLHTRVIDEQTMEALDLGGLATTVSRDCMTVTGRSLVGLRLHNPMTGQEDIRQHQEALEELRDDTRLRDDLQGFLQRVKYDGHTDREADVASCLKEWDMPGKKYLDTTRRLLSEMPGLMKDAKRAESEYLRSLQDEIIHLEGSPGHKLSEEPVYRKAGKMLPQSEVGWSTPAVKYRPVMTPVGYTLGGGGIFAAPLSIVAASAPPVGGAIACIGLAAAPIWGFFGVFYNQAAQLTPLRNSLRDDPHVASAFEAVAGIDELLAKHSFGQRLGDYATLPYTLEGANHEFWATGLVDAQRYLESEEGDTPRDVDLNGELVSIDSSHGEELSSVLVAQKAQVLQQAGCYVPAREAGMKVVDHMSYRSLHSSGFCSFNVVQK